MKLGLHDVTTDAGDGARIVGPTTIYLQVNQLSSSPALVHDVTVEVKGDTAIERHEFFGVTVEEVNWLNYLGSPIGEKENPGLGEVGIVANDDGIGGNAATFADVEQQVCDQIADGTFRPQFGNWLLGEVGQLGATKHANEVMDKGRKLGDMIHERATDEDGRDGSDDSSFAGNFSAVDETDNEKSRIFYGDLFVFRRDIGITETEDASQFMSSAFEMLSGNSNPSNAQPEFFQVDEYETPLSELSTIELMNFNLELAYAHFDLD